MNCRALTSCLALASLLILNASPAPAADQGSTSLPVALFPGGKVVNRTTRSFDEYWIALGKLKGEGQAEQVQQVDGKWTHVAMVHPAGRTVAEVFRHYEQQVAKAGLEVMYSCKGTECGEGGRKTNGDWWWLSDHRRYMAARLQRPRGDLWVTVHVHARAANAPVEHEVDVVEVKPPVNLPPPRDEADVATLEKELRANGRVVLRSLAFSEGKPAVLPTSDGVVKAIAELLSRDSNLKLHVVVHNDDGLPSAAGLEVTKKRAAAVVALLKQRHKVPAARVQPAGLGPLAPMASNATEEGRAQNRRVELVPEPRGREAAVRLRR
jgi:outer membrane protein OmpA-like peptidoglycan-associated protein